MTPARLPVPGPSFVREETVTLCGPMGAPGRRLRAGMALPSVMDDGLWLTHLWIADEAGVVDTLDVAPAAGPPPGTPLEALGPRIAGALSGLVAEAGGRQQVRLRMPPVEDEARPWQRPLVCMTAIRWDPVRAAMMSRNELARELLRGFAAAVEALGRPG
ncbi:MAG TPA: hypothetical protein VJK49_07970 [Candidatus Limnocylindrales bacterium]|nr:hypothetical protein [Candidatus Limnocylindrales bacterium]